MRRVLTTIIQWAASLGVIYVLWALVLAPRTSRAIVVKPSPTFSRIADWFQSGSLFGMVWTTLSEALCGLGAGAASGILLALITVLGPRLVGKVIEPAVAAIYAMPKFVVIPILFLWVGNGFVPRAGFVALAVFAVIYVNLVSGLRTVDPGTIQMLRLYGAGRRQLATKLLLPHAVGYLLTGLTFATSLALALAVGAEMLFGVSEGLGGTISVASTFFDAAGVLGAIVVATGLSALATAITSGLSSRLTWMSVR